MRIKVTYQVEAEIIAPPWAITRAKMAMGHQLASAYWQQQPARACANPLQKMCIISEEELPDDKQSIWMLPDHPGPLQRHEDGTPIVPEGWRRLQVGETIAYRDRWASGDRWSETNAIGQILEGLPGEFFFIRHIPGERSHIAYLADKIKIAGRWYGPEHWDH